MYVTVKEDKAKMINEREGKLNWGSLNDADSTDSIHAAPKGLWRFVHIVCYRHSAPMGLLRSVSMVKS